MKKIVLTAAALLIAAGSAYARNDNVGGTDINKQATVNVDNTQTSSVRNTGSPVYKLLNSSGDVQKSAPQGSDRNLFGPLTAEVGLETRAAGMARRSCFCDRRNAYPSLPDGRQAAFASASWSAKECPSASKICRSPASALSRSVAPRLTSTLPGSLVTSGRSARPMSI